MGVSASVGVGVAGTVVFLQVIFAIVSGFFAQWVNCRIMGLDEFSFGLRNIIIDPPVLNKIVIELHQLDPFTNISDSFKSLVSSSDITLVMVIAAAIMGIGGACCTVFGSTRTTPGKQPSRKMMFNAAVGFLAVDALLVFVAVLLYGLGVMGSLKDIGISSFLGAIKDDLGMQVPSMGMFGSVVDCSEQQMMFGMIISIIQLLLLCATCGFIALAVDTSVRSGEGMRTPALQMQHMNNPGMQPPGMVPGPNGGRWSVPPPGAPMGGPPPFGAPPGQYGGQMPAPPWQQQQYGGHQQNYGPGAARW